MRNQRFRAHGFDRGCDMMGVMKRWTTRNLIGLSIFHWKSLICFHNSILNMYETSNQFNNSQDHAPEAVV